MSDLTYHPAPEVAEIAEDLIPQFHAHLEGCRIDYVFRSEHAKRKGKAVAGTARKITGLNAYLASQQQPHVDDLFVGAPFFVIEIARDLWVNMPESVRRALVDHELSHCWREIDENKGQWVLSILPHDVEEFADVVKRHGLWSGDLTQFVRAAKNQLRLIG